MKGMAETLPIALELVIKSDFFSGLNQPLGEEPDSKLSVDCPLNI